MYRKILSGRDKKMDEYRTKVKTKKKKYLRILAVILSFCVLFTTNADITATLSVFAAGESEGRQYISDFAVLPENVTKQTVPLGTELDELSLPDTLEAFAAGKNEEESGDRTDGGEEENAGSGAGDSGEDGETPEENGSTDGGSEDNPGEEETAGDTDEKAPGGTDEEILGEESTTGGEGGSDGLGGNDDTTGEDGEGSTDKYGEVSEENDGSRQDGNDEAGGEDGNGSPQENDAASDADASDESTDSCSGDAVLKQETHTVTMPEYHTENIVATEVKVCEKDAEIFAKTESDAQNEEESVLIKGVTWNSDPSYDENTEGIYLFMAVLPDGYELAEGVSLPEIVVTVQDEDNASIQEILTRIAALPDADEYLAKEPDVEREDAYEKWMTDLYAYAEEALDIWETYGTLTEEQQARISETETAKLMAWVELAEQVLENSMVMVVAEETCGNLTWTIDDAGTVTVSGTGDMTSLPWKDSPLSSPWNWTHTRDTVTKCVIQPGVTSIADYAFDTCYNLSQVIIPDSVTKIGASAFMACRNKLKTVTIPSSVREIGKDAFYGCGKLATVKFEHTDPATIPSLGSGCFGWTAFYHFSPEATGIKIPSCKYYNDYITAPGWDVYKKCVALVHKYEYTAAGNVITQKCSDCGKSGTATLSVSNVNQTYTGKAIKPATVTCKNWSGTGSNKPSSSNITYENNINAGTATAKLTFSGAVVTIDFTILPAAMADVTGEGWSGVYDGEPHSITVNAPEGATVKYKKTEAGDYTLTANPTYSDAGDYTVYYQVTKDNYEPETGSAGVEISACSINDATVTLDSGDLIYNGSLQTKGISSVTVASGDRTLTLTRDTDYTISYTNNIEAGDATVVLTGKGNYTGSATKTFTIQPKSLGDSVITISSGPYYYTGSAITPAVTVKDGSCTLTKDADYTISYTNNIDVGTATVEVTGKGNYKGTINQMFTIEPRLLPDGKSLTDYVTISPAPVDDWYGSDITLNAKGGGVDETPTDTASNSVVISDETGKTGNTKTIYIKDGSGNIYQTEFPYKLDKTPPVIVLSNMSVENGTKNLWNWIIGKESMIIRIPEEDITDALSGIGEVTYTAIPDSGAQKSGEIRVKSGFYEIAMDAEFSGIVRLTAKDKVDNTSEVSLTAAGGKVIAENYAPVVTIALPDMPEPNENGWYNATIPVTVTVADNKDTGDVDILSGGIARIVWKDGENGAEQTVSELPGASPVYKKVFTISVDTDGAHTYYIKATDNAGNESGWQTVTVKRDTSPPVFTKNPTLADRTAKSAEIVFASSESGKAYWIIGSDVMPDAGEVVRQAAKDGTLQEISEAVDASFGAEGLTPRKTYTVYVVLEDAVGNLSEVEEVRFSTLQEAPNITLGDLIINYYKETVKMPDAVGEVEVYTDPDNPAGSMIAPDADDSRKIEPGTVIYIRYPEKTDAGETTPASEGVKFDLPERPAAPASKQVKTDDREEQDMTVSVVSPSADEEYVLVEKGGTPDWSNSNTTGEFAGLEPNRKYDLWVRKKATDYAFASELAKTEVWTPIRIITPVVTGEGAGESGNTAPKPTAPNSGNETLTFTGTYAEEYTPVIRVGGQEITLEMTWDENAGKGEWKYPYPIQDGTVEVGIVVEFRKRKLTAITVTPDRLKIHADHAANRSAAELGNITPLTTWLEGECEPEAAYDNKTEASVQGAVFVTTDRFMPTGGVYSYTVSAEGKTAEATLTVSPVNAAITPPEKVLQAKKNGGYTQAEVAAWLPAQAAVTYTGIGYTTKTEKRAVTWDTTSIGTDFGGTVGEKTVSGTVDLPTWATGQTNINISIEFTDKIVLSDVQMTLSISGWTYGAQEQPVPRGSVSVMDANPVIAYLYSADSGTTWAAAERLPKSGSGHIVPGEYQVKMTYTGDNYAGTKTAAFAVEKRALTVKKGTLEAEDKNYDGTLTAALKEGGEPALSGVITGDTVSAGGTLHAAFTAAGAKKNVPVTVTGFELSGRDAGCYRLGNTYVTLRATINKADGTPPSDGKKPSGGDKDKEENGDGNSGSGGGDGTSGQQPGVNPSVKPGALPPAETDTSTTGRSDSGQGDGASRKIGEQLVQDTAEKPKDREEQKTSAADAELQSGQEADGTDNAGQTEERTTGTATAAVDDGKVVLDGETASAGNVTGMEHASTAIELGEGAVIVTVVCEEEKYTAGVRDVAAIANAVLSPEHIQLVNDGERIEIRVDVKDISQSVPQRDQEVIESGLAEYQREISDLILGRYVDISMFMKLGKGDWNAINSTEEPIEVVIGIPEDLQEEGREFYIIRAHEGEHTLMRDMDDEPDTITINTNMFSSYAIAYVATGTDGGHKCSLCQICPTFLGICCFIWLAVVTVVVLAIGAVVLRRKKERLSEKE